MAKSKITSCIKCARSSIRFKKSLCLSCYGAAWAKRHKPLVNLGVYIRYHSDERVRQERLEHGKKNYYTFKEQQQVQKIGYYQKNKKIIALKNWAFYRG